MNHLGEMGIDVDGAHDLLRASLRHTPEVLERLRSFGSVGVEWQVLHSTEQAEVSRLAEEGAAIQVGNRVYAAEFGPVWVPASGHPGGWRVVRNVGRGLEELNGKSGRLLLFGSCATAQERADTLNRRR